MPFVDLTGKRFERLVVLGRDLSISPRVFWKCRCDCGRTAVLSSSSLGRKDGKNTRSCGCLQKERAREGGKKNRTHGLSIGGHPTPEYVMWYSAKHRARQQGVPFEIEFEDIRIPEFCPVMGTVMYRGTGCVGPNSPTLDKVDPSKGYVKGNVWVVSSLANTCKQGLSINQLSVLAEHFVTGWAKYCAEENDKKK